MAKKKPLKGPNLPASSFPIKVDSSVHVNQPPYLDSSGRKVYATMLGRGTMRQMGVAKIGYYSYLDPAIVLYAHTQVSDSPWYRPDAGPAQGWVLTMPAAEQLLAMLLKAMYGDVGA
jgi:hypothetical protein